MKWDAQRGERNHRAKLSEADVREIRRIAAERAETQRALAARFGVAESLISRIVRGSRWAHIR